MVWFKVKRLREVQFEALVEAANAEDAARDAELAQRLIEDLDPTDHGEWAELDELLRGHGLTVSDWGFEDGPVKTSVWRWFPDIPTSESADV